MDFALSDKMSAAAGEVQGGALVVLVAQGRQQFLVDELLEVR